MKTHRKGPRKSLEVIRQGTILPGRTATDVYVECLQKIGLERVSKEPLTLSGVSLVSRDAPARAHRQFGEWYVATHSDTAEKHSVLVRLKERLDLTDLEIR